MALKQAQADYSHLKNAISIICKTFCGMSQIKTKVVFFGIAVAINANAQNRCIELFYGKKIEQAQRTAINPTANIDTYNGNTRFSTKLWDIAAMGVLGEMFDLTFNAQNGRNIPIVNEFKTLEVRARTKKVLEESTALVTPKDLEIINRTVKITDLTSDTRLVSVKNYTVGNETPELEQAIKNYFSLSYIRLVNWVYRLSNLEKNDPISSAVMMDEVAEYAVQRIGFEFNLIYDNKILKKHLQIIAKVINEYESTTDFLKRQNALRKLEIEIPLMPTSGVTVAVKITDPKYPAEIKRYFKNDHEDPLGIMVVKQKNEFKLRHAMISKVIEMLPLEHLVEIHAHTKAHVKAYAKLGFVDTGLINNPKYPDAKIHLLRATREQVLEHIKTILDRLE